jgi:plastocyanin
MYRWLLLPVVFLIGLSLAACGGGSDNGGSDTTSTAVPGQGGNGEAPSTALTITAKNLKFDKDTLTAPANTEITVTLKNEDASVMHDFSLYRDSSAKEPLSRGDPFTGVANHDYTFTTPAPGEYFFRCDVHPDTMTGTFKVTAP